MTARVNALVNTAVKPIIMIFHSPHREMSPMASALKIKGNIFVNVKYVLFEGLLDCG